MPWRRSWKRRRSTYRRRTTRRYGRRRPWRRTRTRSMMSRSRNLRRRRGTRVFTRTDKHVYSTVYTQGNSYTAVSFAPKLADAPDYENLYQLYDQARIVKFSIRIIPSLKSQVMVPTQQLPGEYSSIVQQVYVYNATNWEGTPNDPNVFLEQSGCRSFSPYKTILARRAARTLEKSTFQNSEYDTLEQTHVRMHPWIDVDYGGGALNWLPIVVGFPPNQNSSPSVSQSWKVEITFTHQWKSKL
ncbi:putative capsid protein [Pacific flying fox faeces associated circular DNA virus-1]|nr:putative capsid protein [Pacific flying fox faeces associated circular DNA virus-1]